MRRNDRLLKELWNGVCSPVLTMAGARLTPAQASAVALAPLILVATDPPRVALLGFEPGAGAVDCGAYELPGDAGPAIASFLEVGLQQLTPAARTRVAAIVAAGHGQLLASLRPDLGRAEGLLVAHHDRFSPITLFTLQNGEAEVRH